jgi:NitT/TauT family transport system substrate-binding protein
VTVTRAGFVYAGAAALSLARPRALLAQELVELVIASAPDDDITPLLYAQKAGIFAAVGLSTKVLAASNGAAVAAAVAGGAVPIGKASLLSIILAHVRAVPFTIIAPCATADARGNYTGLLVLKDGPIHTASDLNGKVVCVPALNDMQFLATHVWIDANGGDSKSVSFIEAPVTAAGAAIDSGRIAAGILTNPALAKSMATGKYRALGKPIEQTFNGLMISAYVADAGWVAKNADVVKRFGQVMVRASEYAGNHHDQTVDIIADFSGIERATVARMTRAAYATTLDPSIVQPLIDAAARYGAIKQTFDASELISPLAYNAKR